MAYVEWVHRGCGGCMEVILDSAEGTEMRLKRARVDLVIVIRCNKCGWGEAVLGNRFREGAEITEEEKVEGSTNRGRSYGRRGRE